MFTLRTGEDMLTEYVFNTKIAKHMFCKVCGVQSYYRPRSNPDGVAITFTCLKDYKIIRHRIKHFNGQQWENFISKSGIQKFSIDQNDEE